MNNTDLLKPQNLDVFPQYAREEHPIVIALYVLGGIAVISATLACVLLWPAGIGDPSMQHFFALCILWVGSSVGAILAGIGLGVSYIRRVYQTLSFK